MPSMPKVKAKEEEEKEEAENATDAEKKATSTEIAPRILIKVRRVSDSSRALDMVAKVLLLGTTMAQHRHGTKVLSDCRNNSSNLAKVGISSRVGVNSNSLSSSSPPRVAGRAKAQVISIS